MEGTEEVGTAISGFGAEGHGRQEVGDVLQGGGPSGADVCIIDVVHDITYRQDARMVSPSGGLPDSGQITAEGYGYELDIPPSG